jgi:hypothetical protein
MPTNQEASVDRIYSINTDGSNLKLLSYGNAFLLSLTRDTIFICNNDSIYYADLNGSNKHLLTPGSYYNLFFSSGKNKICLDQKSSGHYCINTDGSGLTKIYLPNLLIYSWDISPSGDKVVYSCNRGLFLTNIDGSNSKLLIDTSNSVLVYNVSFTSDGNSLLFIRDNYLAQSSSFMIYNLKSGISTKLFSGYVDYELSLSDTILFSYSGGIYLFNLKNNLYSEITGGGGAHISADASRISYFLADNTEILTYILNSNSIKRTNVYLPGNFLHNANLSTDNNKFVFQADSIYYISKK